MPEWITKYWLEWLFGIGIAAITAYCRHLSTLIRKERAEQKALRDGMRSLLRRQIIADCEKAQQEGFCSMDNKQTIDDMYTSYHALGGNGTVTKLKNQTMDLPTFRG